MHLKRWLIASLIIVGSVATMFVRGQAQSPPGPTAVQSAEKPQPQKLTLSFATMCENVKNLKPVNKAVVFSVSVGQICCFTTFDPVPEATQIYHRWYHHDELSTQRRLRVYPPKWSTYSMIQLRETDKGPWRIEITDKQGNVLGIVRFSITD